MPSYATVNYYAPKSDTAHLLDLLRKGLARTDAEKELRRYRHYGSFEQKEDDLVRKVKEHTDAWEDPQHVQTSKTRRIWGPKSKVISHISEVPQTDETPTSTANQDTPRTPERTTVRFVCKMMLLY